MKTVKRIFWISILALLLIAGIRILVDSIAEESYAIKMQDLDIKTARGSLIAGYDVKEETYTRKCIPKELLAKKPEDVGYLLKLSYGTTGATYSGGHYVTGKTITAQLVDCDTGKIIDEHTFEPYFPMTVSSKTKTVSVDSSVVTNWISKVYPGEEAAQKGDHVWQDATCTDPKTCTVCGATEGKPLGHNFMPNVCTRCGMEAAGQKEEAPAETKPAKQDPEAEAKKLITGLWKLDFIMDGKTYDIVPYDGEIKFQINKDSSAFITTPDEKYSYEWVYNYQYFEDDDSNKPVYSYILIDKAGSEIYFYYYYDNTIGIFTDMYSVFFER